MNQTHSVLKTVVINLVKHGQKVENVIPLFHWTEDLLAEFGVIINTEFVQRLSTVSTSSIPKVSPPTQRSTPILTDLHLGRWGPWLAV